MTPKEAKQEAKQAASQQVALRFGAARLIVDELEAILDERDEILALHVVGEDTEEIARQHVARRLNEALASVGAESLTPEGAAMLARTLTDSRAEREIREEEARAMLARAKARDEARWYVLWPVLKAWAAAQERDKKTVRLPGTTARVTYRASKPSAEINDATAYLAWARQKVGLLEAIRAGLVRVRVEPSRSGAAAWVEAHGDLPNGVLFDRGGEKPILCRK